MSLKDLKNTILKLAKGEITYPENHQPAMKVPKGGSCCANCKWLSGEYCSNKYYQNWNGSNEIPELLDEFCSDWFEPR